MDQYIDLTNSTAFVGLVGLVSPFLFPFLFNLFSKIAKREVTSQEKRLVITASAFLVSVGVVAYHFEWDGDFMSRVWAFVMYLFVNFVTLRGVVQSVYEIILKNIPGLEERIERIGAGK
jgi:hypothetical protein